MADSDKQILITPNISATAYPQIKYVGADNAPMYQTIQDDGTVAFSGAQGEVFSIGHTMATGNVFSANDISGIPLLAVGSDGNVGIGISSSLTAKLHIKTSGETDALRLDVDSSDDPDSTPFVIAEDGRVGIGTASPVDGIALTLNGDGTSYEGIAFQVGGSTKWKVSTDSSAMYIDSQTNSLDWRFRMRDSAGALRTLLALDGGVGGGTDNAPGVVIGNDGGSSSSPGDCMNKLQINVGTTAGVQDFNDGIIIVNNDASIVADAMIGGIGFDTRDGAVPSRTTEASAYIAAYASEAHGSGDKGGYLVFGTSSEDDNENVTSTERLRITDEGSLLSSLGNVNTCVAYQWNRSDMNDGAVSLKAVITEPSSSQSQWQYMMPKSGKVKYIVIHTVGTAPDSTNNQTFKINRNNQNGGSAGTDHFVLNVAKSGTTDNTGVSGNATVALTQSSFSSTLWSGACAINFSFNANDAIRIQRTNANSVNMYDCSATLFVEFD